MKVAVVHPYRETAHRFWQEYFFMPERGVQMATYLDWHGWDVDFIDFGQTDLDDEYAYSVETPRPIKGHISHMWHYGLPESEIEEWFDREGDRYDAYIVDALTPYFSKSVEFVRDQIIELGKPVLFFGEWPQLRPGDFQEYPAVRDNWEVGADEWLWHVDAEIEGEVTEGGVMRFSFDEDPMNYLPAPDWRQFVDMENYPEPHNADVRFSRGCVERCDFCHVAGMYDGRFNFKPPGVIKEDLKFLIEEQGFDKIKIRDDNFCAATDTAKEVFNHIADTYPDTEIMQPEGMEMRTASRDKELIDAIGRCNYHSVRVGFETAAEGSFSKNSLEWWEKAYDWFKDAGFGPGEIFTFVIRGHPKLERSDEIITAIYLSQFDVTMVSGGYRLVPGTELWDEYVDEQGETPPYEYGFGLPIDDEHVDAVGRLYRTVTYWNEWERDIFHDEDPFESLEDSKNWVESVEDTGSEITVRGTVSGWKRTHGLRHGAALRMAMRGYHNHEVVTDTKTEMTIKARKGYNEFMRMVLDAAKERDITVTEPGGLI